MYSYARSLVNRMNGILTLFLVKIIIVCPRIAFFHQSRALRQHFNSELNLPPEDRLR